MNRKGRKTVLRASSLPNKQQLYELGLDPDEIPHRGGRDKGVDATGGATDKESLA
jgi:hypothetical protein